MKLKKVTREKLDEILKKHEKWLNYDPSNCLQRYGCERADLFYCDLRDFDLSGVNLVDAILRNANLNGADLTNADLTNADLSHAYLNGANLMNAYLSSACLSGADLRNTNLNGADLCGSDLCGSDLRDATLRNANLRNANLNCADLMNADLSGSDLRDATLSYADLSDSKGLPPMICPEEGSFIGYKQAILSFIDKPITNCIVELEIMEDAKRSSATSNKCRCDKAKVVSITDLDGNPIKESSAFSLFDLRFIYTVGEIVSVNNFDDNRWRECAPGIHFFMTREEAVNYHV